MNHRIPPAALLISACLCGCQTAVGSDLTAHQSHQLCRDLASLGIPCQPRSGSGRVRVHRAHADVARAVLSTLLPADDRSHAPRMVGAAPTPEEVARAHREGLCSGLMEHTGAWRCDAGATTTLVLHAGPSGLARPPFVIDGYTVEVRSRSVQVPSVPALRALGPLWIAESWRGPLRIVTALGALVAWIAVFWSMRQQGRMS